MYTLLNWNCHVDLKHEAGVHFLRFSYLTLAFQFLLLLSARVLRSAIKLRPRL